MNTETIAKIKRLLYLAIALSNFHQGFLLSKAIFALNEIPDALGSELPTSLSLSSILLPALTWAIALVIATQLIVKHLKAQDSWAEYAALLIFLVLIFSWAAPACVLGIYLVTQNSPALKAWMNELKA